MAAARLERAKNRPQEKKDLKKAAFPARADMRNAENPTLKKKGASIENIVSFSFDWEAAFDINGYNQATDTKMRIAPVI